MLRSHSFQFKARYKRKKKNEIAAQSFSKILGICVNMLLQKLVPEALKFYFFKIKYIHQVSDFYINLKAKLVKFP